MRSPGGPWTSLCSCWPRGRPWPCQRATAASPTASPPGLLVSSLPAHITDIHNEVTRPHSHLCSHLPSLGVGTQRKFYRLIHPFHLSKISPRKWKLHQAGAKAALLPMISLVLRLGPSNSRCSTVLMSEQEPTDTMPYRRHNS